MQYKGAGRAQAWLDKLAGSNGHGSRLARLCLVIALSALLMIPALWIRVSMDRRSFSHDTTALYQDLAQRMREHRTIITGFAALMGAVNDLGRGELSFYAKRMLANFPHIHELGALARVPHDEIEQFEQRVRASGLGRFKIRQFDFAGDRRWQPVEQLPVHYPIIFVAHLNQTRPAVLGMDPYSVPIFRRAIRRAASTDTVVASAAFTRINGGRGFVWFKSVPAHYGDLEGKDDSTGTIDFERIATLMIRAEELMRPSELPSRLAITLTRVDAKSRGDDGRLIEHRPEREAWELRPLLPNFHFRKRFNVAGEMFEIEASRSAQIGALTDPLLALPVGGAVALAMLIAYTLRLGWLRRRERHTADMAIFREKERAQVTLEAIDDCVITTDVNTVVDSINPAACKLLGVTAEQAIHRPLDAVFRPYAEDDGEPVHYPLRTCLHEDRNLVLDRALRLPAPDGGEAIAIDARASPIHDYNGTVTGAALVFRDVTQQRQLLSEMTYQASHDPLTGLVNRRAFEQELHHALANSVALGQEHALCYIDLDGLKAINDRHGHHVGDELLKHFGKQVTGVLRQHDIIARLGGDEFAILFQNCRQSKAIELTSELHRTLRAWPLQWRGQTFEVRFSAGVVRVEPRAGGLQDVLRIADAACYRAKAAGGARTEQHPPSPAGPDGVANPARATGTNGDIQGST